MDFSQMTTVTSITIICYMVGIIAKNFPHIKDEYIPSIAGLVGGILGIVYMVLSTEFNGYANILDAISTGIVSGLASTGVHQIIKQTEKR